MPMLTGIWVLWQATIRSKASIEAKEDTIITIGGSGEQSYLNSRNTDITPISTRTCTLMQNLIPYLPGHRPRRKLTSRSLTIPKLTSTMLMWRY